MKKIANLFSLYFSKPKKYEEHAGNIAKVSAYAGHVLIAIGALTSLPALATLFGGLLSEIMPFAFAVPLTVVFCGLCVYLIDFTLAAFGPFAFAAFSRQEWKVGTISALVTVFLCAVSIQFSWKGNAALVDSVFPFDSNFHNEITATQNEKAAKTKEQTERFDKEIAAARAADAAKLQELKKEGAGMVANAAAAALAKYGPEARTKIAAAQADARRDSAALVSRFEPTAHIPENRKNAAVGDLSGAYDEKLSLLRSRDEEARLRYSRKVGAVFTITGGLGSFATVIGLLCTIFAVMAVAPSKSAGGGSSDRRKEIMGAFGAYKAELSRKLMGSGNPGATPDKLRSMIEELADIDPTAAASKDAELRRDFPGLF